MKTWIMIVFLLFCCSLCFFAGYLTGKPGRIEPEKIDPICDCQKLDVLIENGWTYKMHGPGMGRNVYEKLHGCEIKYRNGDVYMNVENTGDNRKDAMRPCLEKATILMKGVKSAN